MRTAAEAGGTPSHAQAGRGELGLSLRKEHSLASIVIRLLDTRTVKEYVIVVLSHPVGSN